MRFVESGECRYVSDCRVDEWFIRELHELTRLIGDVNWSYRRDLRKWAIDERLRILIPAHGPLRIMVGPR